jgi:hypothetical protein
LRLPPPPDVAPASDAFPGAALSSRDACVARLRAAGHVVAPAESPGGGACAIADPVRLESFAFAGGRVALPDRPTLSCAFASDAAEFVALVAAPLAQASLGSAPTSMNTGPGHECRGRNRVAGAKISAHGRGLAIDVAALRLADGRVVSVERPSDQRERAYLHALRRAACGWFTTVLGPGADAAHANHIHLDSERHGASDRYRLCQ